jgi:tight adherence protein C
MVGFLLLGLVFVAIAAILLLRVVATPRTRAADRLAQIEAYGFAGEPVEATVAPADRPRGIAHLIARIGEFTAERFGRVREDDLRAELMAAGVYSMSPGTLLGYRVLAAILIPVVIVILGSASAVAIVLAIATVPAGWMLPLVLVRRRARGRLEAIDFALPDLIDLLVVTVEAGLGFSGSLRLAAGQVTGPLSDELRLTLQEQTMGLSVPESLTNLMGRADTAAMRSFVRSVVQGETLGVSIGQILRNVADDMRKRRRKAAEERAQKAPVKMLFPLVFLIFPTLLIVLFLPALYSFENTFSH